MKFPQMSFDCAVNEFSKLRYYNVNFALRYREGVKRALCAQTKTAKARIQWYLPNLPTGQSVANYKGKAILRYRRSGKIIFLHPNQQYFSTHILIFAFVLENLHSVFQVWIGRHTSSRW